MKKILFLTIVALIAAPAFAGGVLATKEIPVSMVIDKTVTLSVNPPQITLNPLDESSGDSVFAGTTSVTITHNFPVVVTAVIVPFGLSFGASAIYQVSVVAAPTSLPQTASQWIANTTADDVLLLNTPAPAPGGEIFYVGAAICHADFTFATSSATAQQVATVALTVSDNL